MWTLIAIAKSITRLLPKLARINKLRMRDDTLANTHARDSRVQAPPTPAQTAPTTPDQLPYALWISIDDTPILLMRREENEAACTKDRRKAASVHSYSQEISTAIERHSIEERTYWYGALRVSVQLHGTCLYLGLSLDTSRNNVPVRALLLQLAGNPDDNGYLQLVILLQTLSQRIQQNLHRLHVVFDVWWNLLGRVEGRHTADGSWGLLSPTRCSHINLWVLRQKIVQQGGGGLNILLSSIRK